MVKRVGDISNELRRDEVIPCVIKNDNANPIEIPINNIVSFKNHPFKVEDDEAMEMLKESISEQGILNPVIVRQRSEGGYELISGHRRVFAARSIGIIKIPAIIKKLSDDEAVIAMVDANLQRELLPSEKAFAFKMRMEAISHQGTSRHNVAKLGGSADSIGNIMGLSGRQVQRYIRLTGLNRNLLECVDNKRISMNQGLKIAELTKHTQDILYDYIESDGQLTEELIQQLINSEKNGNEVDSIFDSTTEKKMPTRLRITISKRVINKYFPEEMSSKEIEAVIEKLLSEWSKNNK